MNKWTTKEAFCKQSFIPPEFRYIATNVCKYMEETNAALVVGCIALSDRLQEHWISNFFQDEHVDEFFVQEIVIPTQQGRLNEKWLVNKAFHRHFQDKFFLTLPLAYPARSAKLLCADLYRVWDEESYLFDASREKELLEI